MWKTFNLIILLTYIRVVDNLFGDYYCLLSNIDDNEMHFINTENTNHTNNKFFGLFFSYQNKSKVGFIFDNYLFY